MDNGLKVSPQIKTKLEQKLCGPFLTKLWAILDIHMDHFGSKNGPFSFMGRFGDFPYTALYITSHMHTVAETKLSETFKVVNVKQFSF